MTVSLTAVICNFNKKDYLKGCLDSLLATQSDSLSINVLVVDNASTDGSQQMIENEYGKQVTLIAKAENTGGAGGFATGMRAAVETGGDFVALLDNDILLDTDTLLKLVAYLQAHSEVGVAGAKICTMDNPAILQELGAFIDWENYGVKTPLKGHKDDTSLPDVVVCDYVPACCLVTRTEIIREAGVFDEAHFIYWDDMDWCTRVKLAGYEVHAIASARVQHKMGAVHATNTFSNYYFERNRLRFFASYLSADAFADFVLKRCSELAPQAFFAHYKGVTSQAISAQIALLDFAAGNWFAQNDGVLPKSQYDVTAYLPKHYRYCLCGDDEIKVAQVHWQLIAQGMDADIEDATVSALNQQQLYVVEHILTATTPADGWLIDGYLNVCESASHQALTQNYAEFLAVFNSVEMPVFIQQLMQGYRRFHQPQ